MTMATHKKRPRDDTDGQPCVKKTKKAKTKDDDATTVIDDERGKKKREKKRAKKDEGGHVEKEKATFKEEQVGQADGTMMATQTEEVEGKLAKTKDKKKKKRKEKALEMGTNEVDENGVKEEHAEVAETKETRDKKKTKTKTDQNDEVKAFLETNHMVISDPLATTTLAPILRFSQLAPTALLSKKPFAAFAAPTPIQAASWPYALAGRDVIGVAETGSGKTMAFALPCVEALAAAETRSRSKDKKNKTVLARAVVVSPTRELAMQTHAAMAPLAASAGLSVVCLYGGASKDEQRASLQGSKKGGGADVIVATPGRLKDFLLEGSVLSLEAAQFVVLDEADRMLDRGFEDDVKTILAQCLPREKRQTLMFTATWPTAVRALAASFMVNPVRVTITQGENQSGDNTTGGGSELLQANNRIEQRVEVVEPRAKEQRLLSLLREAQKGEHRDDRILVFCLYKKEAVRVETFLQTRGVKVVALHGDLRQEKRTQSLEAFRSGETPVLVATDVAARGLDVPEVKLVINVTFPLTVEDYVHRIGRTGRAGKTGKAITLFTEHDKAHSGSLINVLRAANQPVPDELLKFGTTVKKKTHDTYGAFFKDVDMDKKGTKITFD